MDGTTESLDTTPESAVTTTTPISRQSSGEPKSIGVIAPQVLANIMANAPSKADVEMQEAYELRRQRLSLLSHLHNQMGERYAACTFDNFKVGVRPQVEVLQEMKAVAARLPEMVKEGKGVFFWGPPGTGKDHLMAALASHAVMNYGMDVCWLRANNLFEEIMHGWTTRTGTKSIIQRLITPQILYLSDPLPPKGEMSDALNRILFTAIDNRYAKKLPVWITVNVKNWDDAAARFTKPVLERLVDGAKVIEFRWPSHRQPERT